MEERRPGTFRVSPELAKQLNQTIVKKPFKLTLIGKFLRGFLRDLPLIGGIRDHIASADPADGGQKGKIDGTVLTGQITAVLLALLALGETLGYLPPWLHDLIQEVIQNIQF